MKKLLEVSFDGVVTCHKCPLSYLKFTFVPEPNGEVYKLVCTYTKEKDFPSNVAMTLPNCPLLEEEK